MTEQPCQVSGNKVQSKIPPLALININDDDINLRINKDTRGTTNDGTDVITTKELYLDELANIDELCNSIDRKISDLAVNQQKEISEIEVLLEEKSIEIRGDLTGTPTMENIDEEVVEEYFALKKLSLDKITERDEADNSYLLAEINDEDGK